MPHDNDETRRAKNRAKARRYAAKHPDKLREKYRKWLAIPGNRQKKQEYNRTYRRLKRPGHPRKYLIQQQAEREFLAGRPRPDICELCGYPPKWRGKLHFDHSHQRGHFRGWLCSRCNTVLGLVEDSPRLLTQMIAYLQRTQTGTSPQFTLPGI